MTISNPRLAELPPAPLGRTGWPWTTDVDVVDRGQGAANGDKGPLPRVTIVTPVLDQVRYVEEAIRSVLLQGYSDLEYVVLDGGSTDGTVEVARRYEPWLAGFSSGPDGGQTQAINAGWRAATGEVLAWLNADDVLLPGAIASAATAFRANPGAGLVYGSAIVVDERGAVLRKWPARRFSIAAMLREGNVVPQPAAFYGHAAIEEVGYLDERWQMIMDFALALQVGARFPSVCLPDVLARFRDHRASKSRTRHGTMARELLRLLDDVDAAGHLASGARDAADLGPRAKARIHYEWALAAVAAERGNGPGKRPSDLQDPAADALRQLRLSLRADHTLALERPLQTAYLVKEAARQRIARLATPPARPGRSPAGVWSPRSSSAARGAPSVQLIGRFDERITGLSRYTRGLRAGLEAAGLHVRLTFPMRPPLPPAVDRRLRALGVDVGSFFSSYPLRASLVPSDIYHLTDQMLATLLLFQPIPGPVVVTVMDIIPYLVQHAPELNTFRHRVDAGFYRLALAGLRRADALVVISEYTRQTLVEVLGLPEERVHVIYPAIDHGRFRPVDVPGEFLDRYGLARDRPYVLYVGSEDPRKNLPTLVRAISRVRTTVNDVMFLKVGTAEFSRERRRLLELVRRLGLQDHVRFVEAVPDEDLPYFYNLAAACALPSLYEGFGLPMAEAMACGTPVVYARSGPLPEVAGDTGVQVEARDPEAFAVAISRLLQDPDERRAIGEAGRRAAARFVWDRTASETKALYMRLLEPATRTAT